MSLNATIGAMYKSDGLLFLSAPSAQSLCCAIIATYIVRG